MKTTKFLLSIAVFAFAGSVAQPVLGQEYPVDTVQAEKVRVDTVVVEKVRVDTVYVIEKPKVEPQQEQAPPKQEQKSKEKNPKVYYGGYANLSFGQFTRIGFEPLIAYKIFPKFSVGAKLSYEYLKDKRYDTDYESSNFGVSVFARRRFFKRLYAHVEYAEMNYKLYNDLGNSDRYWVSFLYLGGGISLPISKTVSVNGEVLWDLIQDNDSPYKTVQPFFNVGIGIGF